MQIEDLALLLFLALAVLWLLFDAQRRFPPLLFVIALAGCPGTARQVQSQTAHAIARGVNASLPDLAQVEQDEGDRKIDTASTLDEARAGLAAVRATWEPIWDAVRVFSAAHDAWSTAIEDNAASAALGAKLGVAYCTLRGALAGRVDLPDHPLAPCPEAMP